MIPLSPLYGVGTFVLKGIFQIWAKKSQEKHEREMAMRGNFTVEEASRLRAGSLPPKEASLARRFGFIFLTVIISLPVISPLFGIPSAITYTEIDPGFLFFTSDREVTRLVTFSTMEAAVVVVPPIIFDIYAMMTGFYFGGKVGK